MIASLTQTGSPAFPFKTYPVHRCLGWYQKIKRVLLLTDTGCEVLKNKNEMTAFFPYTSVTQIKRMDKGIVQILLDDGGSYFFSSQDSEEMVGELIKRINSWLKYQKDIQDMGLGEATDARLLIPPSGVFSPPIIPYSFDTTQPDGTETQPFRILVGSNQVSAPTKNSIYKRIVSRLDKLTGTTVVDRVYSHVAKQIRDQSNKHIQIPINRFRVNMEKQMKLEEYCKLYHLTVRTIREYLLRNCLDEYRKIFPDKQSGENDMYSEVEEISGRCIEDYLIPMQLNNKQYVFDIFKRAVADQFLDGSVAVNQAIQDLRESDKLGYETFEVKPGLRDESFYQEITEDIVRLNKEYEKSASYYVSRQLPIPTPTHIVNRMLDPINNVNLLMSERSPDGKKAKAKGDHLIIGAEDFNPVFEMCLARTNCMDLKYLMEYAKGLLDPVLGEREKGYYSTSVAGLIDSIPGTCDQVHANEYRHELSKLVDSEVPLDGVDKIIEAFSDNEAIGQNLSDLNSFADRYRTDIHRASFQLAPVKDKLKVTDDFVTARLTKKLNDISFSRASLNEYLLKDLPHTFRRDVMLGLGSLTGDTFFKPSDFVGTKDIGMLVDAVRQFDDAQKDKVVVCIPHTIHDSASFTLDRVGARHKGCFDLMLACAIARYGKPSFHFLIRFYARVLPVYGESATTILKLYNASKMVLEEANKIVARRMDRYIAVNTTLSSPCDVSATSGSTRGGQSNGVQSQPEDAGLDLCSELETFGGTISDVQVSSDILKIVGKHGNWAETSEAVRGYVVSLYGSLREKDNKSFGPLSKNFVCVNALVAQVLMSRDVSRPCVERLKDSLVVSAEIDNRFVANLPAIIKSAPRDPFFVQQEFLRLVLEEHGEELCGKEEQIIQNITETEKEMRSISQTLKKTYEQLSISIKKNLEKADKPMRAYIEYIVFLCDLLVSVSICL